MAKATAGSSSNSNSNCNISSGGGIGDGEALMPRILFASAKVYGADKKFGEALSQLHRVRLPLYSSSLLTIFFLFRQNKCCERTMTLVHYWQKCICILEGYSIFVVCCCSIFLFLIYIVRSQSMSATAKLLWGTI